MKRDLQAHQKIVNRALSIAHEIGLEGLSLGVLASELKRTIRCFSLSIDAETIRLPRLMGLSDSKGKTADKHHWPGINKIKQLIAAKA